MNKASHKRKLHLARRLMNKYEVIVGTPPFSSTNWINRGQAIKDRIQRNILKQRKRKVERIKKLVKAHV